MVSSEYSVLVSDVTHLYSSDSSVLILSVGTFSRHQFKICRFATSSLRRKTATSGGEKEKLKIDWSSEEAARQLTWRVNTKVEEDEPQQLDGRRFVAVLNI